MKKRFVVMIAALFLCCSIFAFHSRITKASLLGDLSNLLDKYEDEIDEIFDFSEEQVCSPYIQYVRYDAQSDATDDGYPMTVSNKTWPGLDIDLITAAVEWGNGKVYFFGFNDDDNGHVYARYDMKSDPTDGGIPLPPLLKSTGPASAWSMLRRRKLGQRKILLIRAAIHTQRKPLCACHPTVTVQKLFDVIQKHIDSGKIKSAKPDAYSENV